MGNCLYLHGHSFVWLWWPSVGNLDVRSNSTPSTVVLPCLLALYDLIVCIVDEALPGILDDAGVVIA